MPAAADWYSYYRLKKYLKQFMEAITILEGKSPETIGYAYMIINNHEGQVEQQNTKFVAGVGLKEEDKTFANMNVFLKKNYSQEKLFLERKNL